MVTTPTSSGGGSNDDGMTGDDAREKEEEDDNDDDNDNDDDSKTPGSTPPTSRWKATPFGTTNDDDGGAASVPAPGPPEEISSFAMHEADDVDVESLLEALVIAMEGEAGGGDKGTPGADHERARRLKEPDVDKKRASPSSASSPLLRKSSRGFKLTSLDGALWMEATYDDARRRWKAKKGEPLVASSAAVASLDEAENRTEERPFLDGSTMLRSSSSSPSPEELLRDAARSRRKLRSMTTPEDGTSTYSAHSSVDVEGGGDDGATIAALDKHLGYSNNSVEALEEEEVEPPFGVVDRVRPRAFRERGTHVGAGESSEDEQSVASATHETRRGQTPGEMLLEANLVVEPQRVEAKPIRRRRQRLIFAGVVAVSCAVVALAVGLPLGLPDPPPKPPYEFVNVTSIQGEFNRTLPITTMDAVDHDLSSPPAMAYQWLFGAGTTHVHPVLPKDEALDRLVHRFALATIYYATGGNSTWETTTSWLDYREHECLWYGVDCGNGTADAAAICKNRFGIPSVSCALPNATKICGMDLSSNRLAGTIPNELSLVAPNYIWSVRLESNDLEAFPSALGDLTALRILSLQRNLFSGTFPSFLGYLTNLEFLDLSKSDAVSTAVAPSIPTEIASLTQLQVLELAKTGLFGHLPSQLAALTNLVRLNLAENLFSGPIPSEIGLLTNLEVLSLSSNTFITGTIPTELASLANSLEILSLSACGSLTGMIPTELARLTNLKQLEISGSRVSSTIPTELGELTKLELLYLTGNSLTGRIPTEIGHLRNLVFWKTDGYPLSVSAKHPQNLTGRIPTEIGNCTALQEFSSFGNSHSGRIPRKIGRLLRLSTLDVSTNSLSGPLPTEIGLLLRLSTLSFSFNSLTGPLPTELGLCVLLTSLQLRRNKLRGHIPVELGNLEKLSYLQLSENEFSGSVPTEVGRLGKLDVLSLEGNALTGAVPTDVFRLVNLTYLDLSDNRFDVSHILPELPRLSNLQSLYMRNMSVSGTIPTELGQLKLLVTADLSTNRLSGAIPTELGLWTNASIIVLSHNQLSGTIPTELARLTSLLSLQLFSNDLTGSIPSEIAALSDLVKLRLQGNRLNGTVPSQLCALIDPVCEDDFSSCSYLSLTIDCTLINCTCISFGCICTDPPSSTDDYYY